MTIPGKRAIAMPGTVRAVADDRRPGCAPLPGRLDGANPSTRLALRIGRMDAPRDRASPGHLPEADARLGLRRLADSRDSANPACGLMLASPIKAAITGLAGSTT